MAENSTLLENKLDDMSLGEPDKVSEKDDGAEKYKALVETLSKKEFYDIQNNVKAISPENAQATGQPATHSDQAQRPLRSWKFFLTRRPEIKAKLSRMIN